MLTHSKHWNRDSEKVVKGEKKGEREKEKSTDLHFNKIKLKIADFMTSESVLNSFVFVVFCFRSFTIFILGRRPSLSLTLSFATHCAVARQLWSANINRQPTNRNIYFMWGDVLRLELQSQSHHCWDSRRIGNPCIELFNRFILLLLLLWLVLWLLLLQPRAQIHFAHGLLSHLYLSPLLVRNSRNKYIFWWATWISVRVSFLQMESAYFCRKWNKINSFVILPLIC